MSSSSSSSRELRDELVVEVLSRLGSLNEAVRCSSLTCKRWSNLWRLIPGGGVLDFDLIGQILLRRRNNNNGNARPWILSGERTEYKNWVDGALNRLLHHHRNLDGMKIGFDFYGMDKEEEVEEEVIFRWIEFGLVKRVKALSFRSLGQTETPLFFTPEFLSGHDLTRLEVLEIHGLSPISQAAVDHVLSHSPSLQRFSLRNCRFDVTGNGELAVIRLDSGNAGLNLRSLDLGDLDGVSSVELVSAPHLHTINFRLTRDSRVGYGDDLPRLRDALFSCKTCLLPWSIHEFRKLSPRLQRLRLEIFSCHFVPHLAGKPEWLLFEKLRALDLFINVATAIPSFLECTQLLRAAPALRELSVWFRHSRFAWTRGDSPLPSPAAEWKHSSLKVLRLYGVQADGQVDVLGRQVELAVYVIVNAPSLREVVIDTRRRDQLDDQFEAIRVSDPVEAHVCKARMEMGRQLGGCSVNFSPHIKFIYH